MSRNTQTPNENISIHSGSDHAVGWFIQISDKRFAGTPQDHQGEGYVLDYDRFGFGTNLIGATEKDLGDIDKLMELTEAFIKTLPQTKLTAKYITEIEVIDPDTQDKIQVAIYKESLGGIFGIDSSFIEQTDPETVPSVFGNGECELIEEEDPHLEPHPNETSKARR